MIARNMDWGTLLSSWDVSSLQSQKLKCANGA